MNILVNPGKSEWPELLKRPVIDHSRLTTTVSAILEKVKSEGDAALFQLTKQFDGVELAGLKVPEQEWVQAESLISNKLKNAIQQARRNIYNFHITQSKGEERVQTQEGIQCWRRLVGIERVGLYIPGGSAPLFSTVLMLGVPAAIAGCRQVVLCTPPDKQGNIHPAILYAAKAAGITEVFKVGGAQAIAAMAYGTESVPAVYKIFGPGNQYVTCAKQLVQQAGVAIDMPAGPSEVCVLADESAIPAFVAADLLSQAEHGADSQVLLVTTGLSVAEAVNAELQKQLDLLPRKDIAAKALQNSKAIILNSYDDAMELVNAYAPEHLIISCKDDEKLGAEVLNAGSVFLGNFSPESAGDYASGTNHTLPTNGYARSYSGVSVDSFVKKITYQKLSRQGLATIGTTVMNMAEAEGLDAHARAVSVRLGEG